MSVKDTNIISFNAQYFLRSSKLRAIEEKQKNVQKQKIIFSDHQN